MADPNVLRAWSAEARRLLDLAAEKREEAQLQELFDSVGVELDDDQQRLLALLAQSVNSAAPALIEQLAGPSLDKACTEMASLNGQLPPSEVVSLEPVKRGVDLVRYARFTASAMLNDWLASTPLETFSDVVLVDDDKVAAWRASFDQWAVDEGKGLAKSLLDHCYERDRVRPLRDKVESLRRGAAEKQIQAHELTVGALGPLAAEIAARSQALDTAGRAQALVAEFGDRIQAALKLPGAPTVADLKALDEQLAKSRDTLTRLKSADDPEALLLREEDEQLQRREAEMAATRKPNAFQTRNPLWNEDAAKYAKISNEELSKHKVIGGDDIEGLRRNLHVMFDQPVAESTARRLPGLVEVMKEAAPVLQPEALALLKAKRMGGSATMKDENTKAAKARENWDKTDALVAGLAADKSFDPSPENLLAMVLQVNATLGDGIAEEPGHLRTTVNAAAGFSTDTGDAFPTRMYVPAVDVEREMQEMMGWLSAALKAGDNPIDVAARACQRLASIHPFHDGNGRSSRFVMDFVLQRAGLPPASLGEEVELAVFPRIAPRQQPSPSGAVNAVIAGVKESYKLMGVTVQEKLAPLAAPKTVMAAKPVAPVKAKMALYACMDHPEQRIETARIFPGPPCPTCKVPMTVAGGADRDERLKATDEQAARKAADLVLAGGVDPETAKKSIATKIDKLKATLGEADADAKSIDALVRSITADLGNTKLAHEFSRYRVVFDAELLAIERRNGEVIQGLMVDDSIPLANKMKLYEASARQGNALHNMAVGFLESPVNDKDVAAKAQRKQAEQKYTETLRSMAAEQLTRSAAQFGPGVDLAKEKDYLRKNTALGRVLVQGDVANDPTAAFHPGYWGLFMMPPTSGDEADATRDGSGAYRRRVDDSPGLQVYNTEGNNRRMFMRMNGADGSSMTFSTKGGGMDMTVPVDKINKEFVAQYTEMQTRLHDCTPEGVREIEAALEAQRKAGGAIDIANLEKKLAAAKADLDNGVMHCFAINKGDPAHETVGFGHYSMAGQDFGNIQDKYKAADALARKSPAFASVKAAMVKPMFCTAMARTAGNLDRLPADVRDWCETKQEMPTQVVTASASETSLRLDRGKGKQDQYRMRADLGTDKPIFIEQFSAGDALVKKGEPIYSYLEFDDEADLTALEQAESAIGAANDELVKVPAWVPDAARTVRKVYRCVGNLARGTRHDRVELDAAGACPTCGDVLKAARSEEIDAEAVKAAREERTTEQRLLLKAATDRKAGLMAKGRPKVRTADADVRLGEVAQSSGSVRPGEAIGNVVESGAEHQEFIRLLKAQQKAAPVRVGDEVFTTTDGKPLTDDQRERVEAAYLMTHNLAGSLALFMEVGDTSANLGNSFDARNISNGTVRDEDEWGKGMVRLSDDGKRAVTWTNRDMEDCRESLMAIVRTMDVPANSQLAADVVKLQAGFDEVLANVFQNTRKGTCHGFGDPPVGQQFEKKLSALEANALPESEADFWATVKAAGVRFDRLQRVEAKLAVRQFNELCGRFDAAALDAADLALSGPERDQVRAALASEDIVRGANFSSELDLASADGQARVIKALTGTVGADRAALLAARLRDTAGQDSEFVANWSQAKDEFHAGVRTIMKAHLSKKVAGTAFAGLAELFSALS